MIRLLAYIGLWLFAMFSISVSVAVGVLSALKTFWKIDFNSGMNLAIDIATGIALEKDNAKNKEKKNENKTGRKHTDR